MIEKEYSKEGAFMELCVMGMGYIGIPTSVLFAQNGVKVTGVEPRTEVVAQLSAGIATIEEPGIEEAIRKTVADGSFTVSDKPVCADAYIISVPTPFAADEYKSCDLRFVEEACRNILPVLKKGSIVIVESTIAPTSTDGVIAPIFEHAGYKVGEDVFLSHCPERVFPGKILYELVHNNRVVGGVTRRCAEKAAEVYRLVVKGEIILTTAKTAEMSKCMENTYRDVNIAIVNELAKICHTLDIDTLEVIRIANMHPRVNMLTPGPGVGGHCLAIDPYFIYAKAPEQAKLIKLARDINNSMPQFVCDRVRECVGKAPAVIAAYGVTFKANVDDVRESPAMEVIRLLKAEGYIVRVCDPHVKNPEYYGLYEAAEDADLALMLVDHDQFKEMDYHKLAGVMHRKQLFDTRGFVPQTEGLHVMHY